MEEVGQARLDLQALTSLCIFSCIAEDLLLGSAPSSAQQLCKPRPKLVLGLFIYFFCGFFFVCFWIFLFVCFGAFFVFFSFFPPST